MNLITMPIDLLPTLDLGVAAFGALVAPGQITGTTVFDIVIATIMSD